MDEIVNKYILSHKQIFFYFCLLFYYCLLYVFNYLRSNYTVTNIYNIKYESLLFLNNNINPYYF